MNSYSNSNDSRNDDPEDYYHSFIKANLKEALKDDDSKSNHLPLDMIQPPNIHQEHFIN